MRRKGGRAPNQVGGRRGAARATDTRRNERNKEIAKRTGHQTEAAGRQHMARGHGEGGEESHTGVEDRGGG